METIKTIGSVLLVIYCFGALVSMNVSMWRDPWGRNRVYVRAIVQEMWDAIIWPVRLWRRIRYSRMGCGPRGTPETGRWYGGLSDNEWRNRRP